MWSLSVHQVSNIFVLLATTEVYIPISCLRIWDENPYDPSKSSAVKRDNAPGNPADSSSGNGTYTELFFHKVEYAIRTGKIIVDSMLYELYHLTQNVTLVKLTYTESMVLLYYYTVLVHILTV